MNMRTVRTDQGVRVLVTDHIVGASQATVFEAGIPSAESVTRVVSKVSEPTNAVGNRIMAEESFYRSCQRLTSEQAARLLVPRYYGSYQHDKGTGIVLERAVVDLVPFSRIDTTPEVAHAVVMEIASLAAEGMIATLEVLRARSNRSDGFIAHRDLQLSNLLLMKRAGVPRVVVGDWGLVRSVRQVTVIAGHGSAPDANRGELTLAPEQRGPDGPLVESSFETDLWGVGIALWQLLHGGRLPLRDSRNRTVTFGDPRHRDHQAVLVVDVHDCSDPDSGCITDTDELLHAVARELLSADGTTGGRSGVIARRLPELESLWNATRRSGGTFWKRLAEVDRASPFIDPGPDEAEFFDPGHTALPDAVVDIVRTAQPSGYPARRLRSALPILFFRAMVSLATGIGFGLFVFAASHLSWETLPDPQSGAKRFATGAVVAVVAAVMAAALLVGWFRQRPSFRRRLPVVSAAGAGVVGAATVLGLALLAGFEFASEELMVAAGGGLAAAVVRLSFVESDRAASRVRTARLLAVAVTTVALGAVAATVVLTPLGSLVQEQSLAFAIEESLSGTAAGAPIFSNAHTIAVAPDGSIAIAERLAAGQDVVWYLPRDGDPRILVTTDAWRNPAIVESDRDPGFPEDDGTEAETVVLHSIDGMDFVDDSTLVTVGIDGVSTVSVLDGSAHLVTDRLTTVVEEDNNWSRDVLVVAYEGEYYVRGGAPDADIDALPGCTTDWATPGRNVWVVSANGDVAQYEENGCSPYIQELAEVSGVPAYVAWRPAEDGGDDIRYLRTVDGENSWDIPPNGSNDFIRQWVSNGDVLLKLENSCFSGYSLDGSSLPSLVAAGAVPDPVSSADCAEVPDDWRLPVPANEPDSWSDAGVCSSIPAATDHLVYWAGGYEDPMTTGSDGSIYLLVDADAACSQIVWRLAPGSNSWERYLDVPTQTRFTRNLNNSTSWMTALNLRADPGGKVSWTVPRLGTFSATADYVVSVQSFPGPYTVFSPYSSWDAEDGSLRVGFGLSTVHDVTTLQLVRTDEEDDPRVELLLPGIRDFTVGSDGKIIVARCGQVLEVDPAAFEGLVGVVAPAAPGVVVIAGTNTAADSPCPETLGRASASRTGLLGEAISPLSIDTVPQDCTDCLDLIVFSEGDEFAGETESRVRVIDRNLGGGTIYTVGIDPDVVLTSDHEIAGDLTRYGLIASDVAMADDGSILVSTYGPSGIGPVLWIDPARGSDWSRVDVDGRLISTVEWVGGRWVLGDAFSGDILYGAVAPPRGG